MRKSVKTVLFSFQDAFSFDGGESHPEQLSLTDHIVSEVELPIEKIGAV